MDLESDSEEEDFVPNSPMKVPIIIRSFHAALAESDQLGDSLVIVELMNHLYKGLVDSGARRISCVSMRVVTELKLSVVRSNSKLSLADTRIQVDSLGYVDSLQVTFLFVNYEKKSITLKHRFEVIVMDDEAHDFIIGTDLIGLLFGKSLPVSFMDGAEPPQKHIAALEVEVKSNTEPTSSSITTINGPEGVINTNTVPQSALSQGLKELMDQIHSEGAGKIPDYELPKRTVLYNSEQIEQEYAEQRKIILERIQPLIEINQKITGFCTHPDAVVHLHVDPNKKPKLWRNQYRIPETLMPLVRQVIQRWKLTGRVVLAPKNCQYNSPLTCAPKKDDEGKLTGIRVCLDTRLLNDALLVTDKFPLPFIMNSFEIFAGCNIFSEFDLSEAYLQFRFDEESQPYTAFMFEGEHLMFVGCCFGIKSLPGIFQRVMGTILRPVPYCKHFIDNLPFGSRGWTQHLEHVESLLKLLNEVNLKVKPNFKIGYASLKILGHQISYDGISLDPSKLDSVVNWPYPRTGKEMESFLGLLTFLCGNIRHFAELTAPLHAVKHEAVIPADGMVKEHFELVKVAALKAITLQYPDFEKPFHLATDASDTGIGGVLFQPKTDAEHITADNIVGIYSHILTKTERKYPAYRKELLGVVRSLLHFHHYLWGRNDTVVHTDHKPLTFIKTSPQLSPPLQQWLDIIQNYDFEIRHRAGILHVIPDQLSRMYTSVYKDSSVWGVPLVAPDAINANAAHDQLILQSIQEAIEKFYKEKPTRRSRISVITRRQKRNNQRQMPVETSKSKTDAADNKVTLHVKPSIVPTPLQSTVFASAAEEAIVDDEAVADNSVQRKLIVELERRGKKAPSKDKRIPLVQRYHAMGHFGRDAVYNSLYADGYWWLRMRRDIDIELKNCDACIRYVVTRHGYHPAEAITALLPGDHIQIDCSVHLPETPEGYGVLLHGIDVFTGLIVLLVPLKNSEAETIALELVKLFALIGIPKILQSDNGPEFVNKIVAKLTELMGIDHRLITPYHPEADGKVERSVGTTTMIIKKLLHGSNQHWNLFVPFAQLTFNNKISSLTGSTPYSLFFGRKMNELRDYTAIGEQNPQPIDLNNWTTHQEKIVSLIYPAVNDRIKLLKSDMVQRLNKHRRLLTGTIPKGAIVMVRDPNRQNKFEAKYIGPYTVLRRARNGAYVLKDNTGDLFDRHVTADQLKLISKQARRTDIEDAGKIYTVEKILDHEKDEDHPGKYWFKLLWKGYPEPEWIHQDAFIETDMIAKYFRKQRANTNNSTDASAAAAPSQENYSRSRRR